MERREAASVWGENSRTGAKEGTRAVGVRVRVFWQGEEKKNENDRWICRETCELKSPEGLPITMECEERGPNPVENWNSHVKRTHKCEGRAQAVLEHVTQTSLCEVCSALFSSFRVESSSALLNIALSCEDVPQSWITGTQWRYKVSHHSKCSCEQSLLTLKMMKVINFYFGL